MSCTAAHPQTKLDLSAPIARWDEAIPLGNGLTGGLLWGGGSHINLSLDRGDLWDQRLPATVRASNWTYATMKRLVHAGDEPQMTRLFDDPYFEATPTKLPVARVVLDIPSRLRVRGFSLNFAAAQGSAEFTDGSRLRAFFSARAPVAMLRMPFRDAVLHIVRPVGLDKLGYAPARTGAQFVGGVHLSWMEQRAAQGLRYAVVVGSRPTATSTTLAIAITATPDGADPLAIGKRRVQRALASGYDATFAAHVAWWHAFWATSSVSIPDVAMQRQYEFTKYLYGAGSRRGAPPIPLQGVWTADEGGLPPWKGDFHNDLNTQMTYLAYPEAGLFDEGSSFIDFNWQRLGVYERFARTFYGVPGAVVPGVETLDGSALGGWSQYALSPTMGAWVAQSFYLHWRYTMDPDFLRERAYPFTAQIGTSLAALLHPDARGQLVLPLSSSPEIFDNTLRAWLPPDSNFDTALLRWLYGALVEMATAKHDDAAARHWMSILARIGKLDTEPGPHGAPVLTLAHGIPFTVSHRHFSHVIGVYPLGLISVHDSAATRRLIDASVANIAARGSSAWDGYSFGWMSAMQARTGNAELAWRYLADFDRAFISRNGFHLNGDQSHTGLSDSTDQPFTLEGNFVAMQAVNEMLLQSAGGVVRVFPATTVRWQNVSFENLRGEGGFRISATRRHGRTSMVRITAGVDGSLRLANPFPQHMKVQWSRTDGVRAGDVTTYAMHAGDTLTASVGP